MLTCVCSYPQEIKLTYVGYPQEQMFTHFHTLYFQNRINQMQMKLGEVESGMDSAIKSLEQAQEDLDNFDEFVGDPKTLETHMKKLQVILQCFSFIKVEDEHFSSA